MSSAAATSTLMGLDPVSTLLSRVSAELSCDFREGRAIGISRAPGRLDVMGGIADYTGSLVCEATLDRAAAVALQARDDRNVQVVSFNLLDDRVASKFTISMEALANSSVEQLRKEFADPSQRWAGYMAGCLAILGEAGLVDLKRPDVRGVNLALYSTVPLGAGVSSSAAVEVATMMNLCAHYGVLDRADGQALDPLRLASMCQQVENRIVGAPCGIMDQVSSCLGQPGSLLRMVCQPHEIKSPLTLPVGVRVIGINSRVRHHVAEGMYGKTRCAAFMGHRMILEKMRDMGNAANRSLDADPMKGYLANLAPEDYKRFFRPYLPDSIDGKAFLEKYGPTIDTATTIDPAVRYSVQHAADHHVLEAQRVRNFVQYMEAAMGLPAQDEDRKGTLDKAGHLMYASHQSYTHDAMLGSDECDLLVQLVREREFTGLYGAKITGGGSGGTVAVLCDEGASADEGIAGILAEYRRRTGIEPEAFLGSSPGAWHVGTAVV